jgi:predicted nucleotidyltransferase
MIGLLTHKDIAKSVKEVMRGFPVSRASYFGSYADGRANAQSDLDVLVEFDTEAVSLLTLIDLKFQLEDALGIPVDVIHAPVPEGSLLEIDNEIPVYAA